MTQCSANTLTYQPAIFVTGAGVRYTRSMIVAIPMPPPMQSVTRPCLLYTSDAADE